MKNKKKECVSSGGMLSGKTWFAKNISDFINGKAIEADLSKPQKPKNIFVFGNTEIPEGGLYYGDDKIEIED